MQQLSLLRTPSPYGFLPLGQGEDVGRQRGFEQIAMM